MSRYLMSLLASLLTLQLADCPGYDVQENLVYHMNQELLRILKDGTGEQLQELLVAQVKVK